MTGNVAISLILRVALAIAYCFLGLWFLMFTGILFGTAFLTTFTVENGFDHPISITPVGTVGPAGLRSPLPVSHKFLIALPSASCGGYEIQPNEKLSITYDMDDINLSEIVVEDTAGVIRQLIVNSNPTANQYRAPMTKHFVVKAELLVPVSKDVFIAAREAQQHTNRPVIMGALLLVPWPAVLLLSWLQKKHASAVRLNALRTTML